MSQLTLPLTASSYNTSTRADGRTPMVLPFDPPSTPRAMREMIRDALVLVAHKRGHSEFALGISVAHLDDDLFGWLLAMSGDTDLDIVAFLAAPDTYIASIKRNRTWQYTLDRALELKPFVSAMKDEAMYDLICCASAAYPCDPDPDFFFSEEAYPDFAWTVDDLLTNDQ
jgi:hypothetical protein